MALKPGTFLGQYEILALLGVGGMGEVYHARDVKLNREVALKLLPEHFARDPERILRFRREAQLLAQLNHPNIALLYYFEETPTARFLVMEYVPGETLRDKIREQGIGNREQKGIPLEEALTIAKQIAEALEHAHEKPIIHRDLKPANVKITPEGKVKVLDFGLAKAFANAAQPVDPADIPTGGVNPTLAGTILGTPAYMSPEQARGKEVDKRADIWSFGCVLYELLTGQWVFQSHPSPDRKGGVASPAEPPLPSGRGSDQDSVADIIGAVMHKEPDWSALPPDTPPGIRTLLRRCLEKDAKRRFSSAADIQIQIEEALTTPAAEVPAAAPAVAPRPLWQRAIPFALTALVAAVLAGVAIWTLRPTPAPQSVSRLLISLPPDQQFPPATGSPVALSPDGTRLAFVARGGGAQRLFLRDLDGLEAQPIPGTEGAFGPFFSPDGQWIGFFAAGKLKKVSVNGGAVLTLCDASTPRGADWGPNDTIVFAPNISSGLFQVSAAGGAPQELTALQENEGSHRWPQFLPDGKAIVFAVQFRGRRLDELDIAAQHLDTAEHRVVLRGGSYPKYAPTGHLVYGAGVGATIMAVPFDPASLEVRGTPAPVLEGIRSTGIGGRQASFSDSGTLVYVAGETGDPAQTLVWVDRKAAVQSLEAPPRPYETPRLSPDGSRVAVRTIGENQDIWVYELERRTLSRLTFDEEQDETPVWTPDGKWITFGGDRDGTRKLLRKLADGGGEEEELAAPPGHAHASSWSPDGKALAFEAGTGAEPGDIWVLPSEGDPSASSGQGRKPIPFLRTPFNERGVQFSPDGRWLAYASDESGQFEVYVQPYPGPGGKRQISPEGGEEPIWARSGRELFYRNGDKMMAVEISTQPSFSASSPRILFEGQYSRSATWIANYDVSPDGQRFLMLKPDEQQAAPTQIHVVLNWFEELKRRVPIR